MKFSMQLDENDVKEALAEWAHSKHEMDIEKENVKITIYRGDDELQGARSDYISVEIVFDKN